MSNQEPDSRTSAAIAMVATSSAKLPDRSGILKACGVKPASNIGILGTLFGRTQPTAAEHQWQDNNLIFPYRDSQLAVSLMPAPIPWSQLEGPCSTAWWWPQATSEMKAHTHHFLIAIIGGSIEPIERRLILTKVVSAVLRGGDAVGVYWGEGTLVHEPAQFILQSKSASAKDIPGTLWIDVRVEQNDDGTFRCFTTGMEPLGFLEIEVANSILPPEELMMFIGNTACYIANNRLHIPEGNTMGRTATEQYRVLHTASMFDRSKVMQLVMM
ncbi:MAG: DUF4261 domain-containing protein [Pirellula sp.]|nr:DUF4261 domain-containing protein [Pirellula sp.]